MTSNPDAARFLETCRKDVDKFILEWYRRRGGIPRDLRRACTYALGGGGKRVRPALAISSCEACGGRRAAVLPSACAVELVHTYSLVHDDLPCMDDDDIRRGRPAAHRAFGEASAVLAGDALLTDAFLMAADGGRSKAGDGRRTAIVTALSAAAGSSGMIAGQVLDIAGNHGRPASRAWIERMFALKTGRLIAAAVEIGGICAGATGSRMRHLRRFGTEIGLAFQLTDDILDAEAGQRDPCNYAAAFGVAAARRRVYRCTRAAEDSARALGRGGAMLGALAELVARRLN